MKTLLLTVILCAALYADHNSTCWAERTNYRTMYVINPALVVLGANGLLSRTGMSKPNRIIIGALAGLSLYAVNFDSEVTAYGMLGVGLSVGMVLYIK